MDYNLEDLHWKCANCEASAAPTNYDYMKLLKHQKGHHISLVDKKTGKTVAVNPKEARGNSAVILGFIS